MKRLLFLLLAPAVFGAEFRSARISVECDGNPHRPPRTEASNDSGTENPFHSLSGNRLLYGTDTERGRRQYEFSFHLLETLDEAFYENGYRYHWAYYGFGLDDKVLEKLYRTNALKIVAK